MQLHTDNEMYFKFYLISDLNIDKFHYLKMNTTQTSHFDYKSIYYRHVTLNRHKNLLFIAIIDTC